MMDREGLIEQQGWNRSTVLELVERFICERGLDDALDEFLNRIADDENAEQED